MPCQICPAEELIEAYALAFDLRITQTAARVKQAYEAMDIYMLREEPPIEPARFVILTISIVVAGLCASDLVSHENHGHTRREHRDGQKVLHLSISKLLHCGIIARAFNAAVPASVVVCAVALVFPIRLIMLLIIRDEVVQCETVMTRHIVNTLLRPALFMTVNCGATEQAISKPSHRCLFPTKKASNVVSEFSVPLLPTVPDEAADLVKAGRVPGLGDELGSSKHRV